MAIGRQAHKAATRASAACAQDRHFRDMMMPDEWYDGLDAGIRFAVRVLHAAGGIETCQSCQGGDGHAYDRPTVDMIASDDDAIGFHAVAALQAYGLPVEDLSIVWSIRNGLPYEKLWRVTFSKTLEDRANDRPNFVNRYMAS
jgi:hypothetical protein